MSRGAIRLAAAFDMDLRTAPALSSVAVWLLSDLASGVTRAAS